MVKKFHRLYNLTFSKKPKIDRVVATRGACLIFRRLWKELENECCRLEDIIDVVILSE
jgi:hypothetical protein